MDEEAYIAVLSRVVDLRMDWLPPTWVVILVVTLLALYLFCTWPYDYFNKRGIAFKRPVPFFGNLAPFILKRKSLGDALVDVYQSCQGHALAGYFEFLDPIFLIRDPEMIKRIRVKDFDYFTDHRSPIREDEDPIFGRSLVALQGQRWRDMRHTLSPAFTASKMKAMFLLVAECGKQMVAHLKSQCKGEANGMVTLEMKDLFGRFANDVIATAAFGVSCDSLGQPDNEFYRVGAELTNFGGRNGLVLTGFLFSPALMKFLKITFISSKIGNFFRHLIRSTIAAREKEGIVRPDMIHLLMQAQKGTLQSEATDEAIEGHEDHKGTKLELSDEDITAQAVLFFVGGFDSTSTLLCFLTHQMAVHPDIQKRVQDEVDEVLAHDGGKVTYEGIQRMKYLDMVISETLRLFPTFPQSDRMCVKPYTLPATPTSPSVILKEGDVVVFPTIGLQRDPLYWQDPMRFDPERFSEENKHKIVPYTYAPFGTGPRVCMGMRFVMMEVKIAIASLIDKFEFHVVAKTTVPDRLQKWTFTMGLEGGFWLGLKPRPKTVA